jgi:hypothetical protein
MWLGTFTHGYVKKNKVLRDELGIVPKQQTGCITMIIGAVLIMGIFGAIGSCCVAVIAALAA